MSRNRHDECLHRDDELRVLRSAEKIDRRRDKAYGKRAQQTVYHIPKISSTNVPNGYQFCRPMQIFETELRNLLDELYNLPDRAKLKVDEYQGWSVHLKIYTSAEKPSKIISDEEALALLPADIDLIQSIRTAHNKALVERDKINEQYTNLKQTQRLLNWVKERTEKQAKENMRFEQRLKALSAEYRSEVELIAAKELKDTLKHLEEHKGDEDMEDFEQEDFDLFEKHAIEFVCDDIGNGLPSRFPGRGNSDDPLWIRKKVGFMLELDGSDE